MSNVFLKITYAIGVLGICSGQGITDEDLYGIDPVTAPPPVPCVDDRGTAELTEQLNMCKDSQGVTQIFDSIVEIHGIMAGISRNDLNSYIGNPGHIAGKLNQIEIEIRDGEPMSSVEAGIADLRRSISGDAYADLAVPLQKITDIIKRMVPGNFSGKSVLKEIESLKTDVKSIEAQVTSCTEAVLSGDGSPERWARNTTGSPEIGLQCEAEVASIKDTLLIETAVLRELISNGSAPWNSTENDKGNSTVSPLVVCPETPDCFCGDCVCPPLPTNITCLPRDETNYTGCPSLTCPEIPAGLYGGDNLCNETDDLLSSGLEALREDIRNMNSSLYRPPGTTVTPIECNATGTLGMEEDIHEILELVTPKPAEVKESLPNVTAVKTAISSPIAAGGGDRRGDVFLMSDGGYLKSIVYLVGSSPGRVLLERFDKYSVTMTETVFTVTCDVIPSHSIAVDELRNKVCMLYECTTGILTFLKEVCSLIRSDGVTEASTYVGVRPAGLQWIEGSIGKFIDGKPYFPTVFQGSPENECSRRGCTVCLYPDEKHYRYMKADGEFWGKKNRYSKFMSVIASEISDLSYEVESESGVPSSLWITDLTRLTLPGSSSSTGCIFTDVATSVLTSPFKLRGEIYSYTYKVGTRCELVIGDFDGDIMTKRINCDTVSMDCRTIARKNMCVALVFGDEMSVEILV